MNFFKKIEESGKSLGMFANHLFPKTSQRTLPEQTLGLAIYFSVCFTALLTSRLSVDVFSLLYFTLQAFGMWALWRRHSLRFLKLELSLFLLQFFFLIGAQASFSSFLSLVAFLMLFCNTLICFLLFRKKESFAGFMLALPLAWTFYVTILNMMLCISTH